MNREKSEIRLQSEAYTNLYNERPDLRGRIFAINNNSENAIKGAMNKAMGVHEGVADMCFICKSGRVIWIEWKTEIGVQSKAQKDWEKLVTELGHKYIIVKSESEFLKIIADYE